MVHDSAGVSFVLKFPKLVKCSEICKNKTTTTKNNRKDSNLVLNCYSLGVDVSTCCLSVSVILLTGAL